jgi:hypothetical protein
MDAYEQYPLYGAQGDETDDDMPALERCLHKGDSDHEDDNSLPNCYLGIKLIQVMTKVKYQNWLKELLYPFCQS